MECDFLLLIMPIDVDRHFFYQKTPENLFFGVFRWTSVGQRASKWQVIKG
jgi:hypothetical protein